MEASSSYRNLQYVDKEAKEMAQLLLKIPKFHVSFDETKKISKEDIQSILDFLDTI